MSQVGRDMPSQAAFPNSDESNLHIKYVPSVASKAAFCS